jgi:hypothetical protein
MPKSHGTIPLARDRKRAISASRGPRLVTRYGQRIESDAYQEASAAPGLLQVCWPVVVGVMLAVVAPRILSMVLAEWGEVGERLVFPFVALAGRPEFGFSAELTRSLPELVLYLTFPVFGIYAMWNLSRRVKLSITIAQIAFVNLIAAFVLWLLSKPGATHGM